jgi:hypothetical protein
MRLLREPAPVLWRLHQMADRCTHSQRGMVAGEMNNRAIYTCIHKNEHFALQSESMD